MEHLSDHPCSNNSCLSIWAIWLAIAALEVRNASLVQAAHELRPLANDHPESVLWGGCVLAWFYERRLSCCCCCCCCCARNTAAFLDNLDRGVPLTGIELEQAFVVVSSIVASTNLQEDSTALAIASCPQCGSCGDQRRRVGGCDLPVGTIWNWIFWKRYIPYLAGVQIWWLPTWTNLAAWVVLPGRFKPLRLLQLVAHPGDYAVHLHPILVVISAWTIREIPEIN